MRILYKLTNKINGKCYIGQTNNFRVRMNGHKNPDGHCSILHSAIIKYGWNNFDKEILGEYTDNEIDSAEVSAIIKYNSLIPNGYNIEEGGCTNKKCADRTKELLRVFHTGKTLSDEHKEKLSKAHTGKKLSNEHVEKIKTHFKTMPRTEQHCINIAKSLTGKTLSDDTKRKIAEAHKGPQSEETKRKRRETINKNKLLMIQNMYNIKKINCNFDFNFN
ncbi:MAG: GIY-YIG nuclease family protein [Clostridia bacterium]|nr:GIY-YIG nuclease family protein [Clostridia bacterium]